MPSSPAQLTGIILSLGTDLVLNVIDVFPALGEPMSDPLLLLATAYRTLYGVVGGYIAARLAPDRPTIHALALGVLGLVASAWGAVVTWNKGPAYGHSWYPLRAGHASRSRPRGPAASSAMQLCRIADAGGDVPSQSILVELDSPDHA